MEQLDMFPLGKHDKLMWCEECDAWTAHWFPSFAMSASCECCGRGISEDQVGKIKYAWPEELCL